MSALVCVFCVQLLAMPTLSARIRLAICYEPGILDAYDLHVTSESMNCQLRSFDA